jgi:hypothetical protein
MGDEVLQAALQVLRIPQTPDLGVMLFPASGAPRWIDANAALRDQGVKDGDRLVVKCRTTSRRTDPSVVLDAPFRPRSRSGARPSRAPDNASAAPAPALPENYKVNLGDYEDVRLLAKGGYGEVRLAKHRTTGQQVAIKHIQAEMTTPKGQCMFAREVCILATICHECVLGLLGHVPFVPESGNSACIVT